jgi:taurine dioxygenase
MKIKVPNNPAQLGVEISDLNLSEEFSVDQIAEIRKSWTDYGVAIFPDQKLTHENFEKFSLLFGNFGDDPYLKSLDDRPNIVEVKRAANEKAPPFGGNWHSDWSFQKTPPCATLLHSKIVPPQGGDTLFANTQLAYEDLDQETKDKIENLEVIHSAALPYADDGFYATEKVERAMDILPSKKAKETQLHPLVKTHAETMKKCLFINPVYTVAIDNYSEEESFLLLSSLYEHMTQEKYVYRHKWSKDMLLMWDNRTVVHAADGGYDGYERLMHRITVN